MAKFSATEQEIPGVVLVRALLGTYTEHNVVRVRVAAMSWHFVDAVWLLMFVSLYLF